jgi:hypothetical protein
LRTRKKILQLQKKSLESKDKQIAAVQSTVKSEMNVFAEIAKSETSSSVTAQNIQRAVKSAVSEDQRGKNYLFFGLQEDENNYRLRARVAVMTKQIVEGETPPVKDINRVGAAKSGESRPVRVSFEGSLM